MIIFFVFLFFVFVVRVRQRRARSSAAECDRIDCMITACTQQRDATKRGSTEKKKRFFLHRTSQVCSQIRIYDDDDDDDDDELLDELLELDQELCFLPLAAASSSCSDRHRSVLLVATVQLLLSLWSLVVVCDDE